MKKSLFALAAVACFGLMSAGCDEDSLNDALSKYTNGALVCSDVNGDNDDCAKMCEDAGLECGDAGACQVNVMNNDYAYSCVVSKEVCDEQGLVVTPTNAKTADGVEYKAYNCAAAAQDVECNKDADCDVENGYKCDIDGEHGKMNSCYNPADYGVSDKEYKFIKVQDESAVNSNGDDPGADIDAIVLKKADGSQYYAADVKAYYRGDGSSSRDDRNKAFDPTRALGAPDSVLDVTNPDGSCRYIDTDKTASDKMNTDAIFTFVSLGGKTEGKEGGYIIVEMQKAAENGDEIFVVELGDCTLVAETTRDGGANQKAKKEPISVSVSVSDDYADESWVTVINSSEAVKGVVTGTIAGLSAL